MPEELQKRSISQQLSHRLLPVAASIGLLIALLFPATYYWLEHRTLRHTANIYAQILAEEVEELVFNEPDLWKYQTYKYIEILQDFKTVNEITEMALQDEKGKEITELSQTTANAGKWWNWNAPVESWPITYNNRQVGKVILKVSERTVFVKSAVILSVSLVIGIGLALLAYRFPLRVVWKVEGELDKTIDKLSRSNTELEQFAYIASHDLQEPLRMVSSYVKLLARRYQEQLGPEADEYIGFAVDGASRMQTLINDLLTYSRVNTRGKELARIDSGRVLRDVVQNLKLAIEEQGAEITHDTLPTVTADYSQLGQLFQNLIGNAIKFHGDAPPRVHITAEKQGDECFFSVRDNGIGISAEHYERIFQIFQRLHTRTEYPGSGIGLAVCKKIIERHGGRIWLTSTEGSGTTFYFTLAA